MHERVSVNTLCFMGAPFETAAAGWRELKPRRVGLVTGYLFELGVEPVKRVLTEGNYRLDVLSHQFQPGHISQDEATWVEPRKRLSQAIAWGKQLDARCLYMTVGGRGNNQTWEQAAAAFSAAVAPCLPEAKAAGIEVLVEPSNALYAHSHIAHSLRDTITLAEMANIGVCIDLFAVWTEAGIKDSIKRAMPRLHLVQVSDYCYGDRSLPCRAVPGDGVIPLKQIFSWLLEAGYKHTFDLELLGPRIDAEGHTKAAGRAAEHVGELLRSLGA